MNKHQAEGDTKHTAGKTQGAKGSGTSQDAKGLKAEGATKHGDKETSKKSQH